MNMMMMVVPTTASYTSLKDIMPHPTTTTTNASWNEIPNIKNPLLKQAALAYLQPISTPPDLGDNKSFFDKCFFCPCGGAAATPQSGCFPWLFTLLEDFVAFFCDSRRIRRMPNEDQRHEHHDDDDDDDNVE